MSPQQTNENDNAGIGIGVVQPQSGLDYPFVSPGLNADPTYLLDVRELFADFYLSYDDRGYYWNTAQIANPLRVYWLYGFGDGPAFSVGQNPVPEVPVPTATHAKDLIVIDSNNKVVFDSTQADYFEEVVWGDHYKIFEWRRIQKPDQLNRQQRAVCRAVQFLHLHDNTTIPERPISFCPRNAVLDERTIEKIPKRVLAMRVQNGSCVSPWFHDKVTLVNGYNTELTSGSSLGILTNIPTLRSDIVPRLNTDISLRVAAGAGKGQFGVCATQADCEEDQPTNVCPPGSDVIVRICDEEDGEQIKSLNGIVPNKQGNINLNAGDCLFIRKPASYIDDRPKITYNVNGQEIRPVMHIGGECGPCCACEDYLETAKYMKKIADKYDIIGEKVSALQALHKQNIERWNAQRECRLSKPLKLIMMPQPCPCMDVAAMYCNHCDECAENVRLTISFTGAPGAKVTVDPDYTVLVGATFNVPAVLGGSWPVFYADFPTVKTGASVYVKFRICFCPAAPHVIRGVLTGVKRGGPILAGCVASAPVAEARAEQILDCPST